MGYFESCENKVVVGLSLIFTATLVFFIIFRNELLILGFLPCAFYMHYFLYKPKYLQNYSGSFVELTESKLNIVRPAADYKATINFNDIEAVSDSSSFFLPSVVVHQRDDQKVELVNFESGLKQAIKGRL